MWVYKDAIAPVDIKYLKRSNCEVLKRKIFSEYSTRKPEGIEENRELDIRKLKGRETEITLNKPSLQS